MSDMASPYKIWAGLQSHALGEAALDLRARFEATGRRSRLSPLIAMSDPKRTPNILEWVNTLPVHCAVIHRYDKFDESLSRDLRALTLKKHQQLLIRAETILTACDGLHFKRHSDLKHINAQRRRHPTALLTLAGLKTGEYSEPLPALDGLLVSAIFPSQSPSAGKPIGLKALKAKTAQYKVPIFALGGVDLDTAPKLRDTGVAGIAAIGAFTKKEDTMTKEKKQTRTDISITKEINGNTIQFIAHIDGISEQAVLDMRKVSEGVYNAHHTGVPKSMGGKGVGTALVKAMSEDAKNANYKVIPACPFIAAWFKRKPDWAKMAALNPEEFKSKT